MRDTECAVRDFHDNPSSLPPLLHPLPSISPSLLPLSSLHPPPSVHLLLSPSSFYPPPSLLPSPGTDIPPSFVHVREGDPAVHWLHTDSHRPGGEWEACWQTERGQDILQCRCECHMGCVEVVGVYLCETCCPPPPPPPPPPPHTHTHMHIMNAQIFHKLLTLEQFVQNQPPVVRPTGKERDFIMTIRTGPLEVRQRTGSTRLVETYKYYKTPNHEGVCLTLKPRCCIGSKRVLPRST